MSYPGEDPFGLKRRAGDAHYRAYVGPPNDYDLIAGLQFSLLFHAGLREAHRLLDLGCGSLRGGRLFIPYLRPGHYYGVEPNEWLVQEGIALELGSDILRVKQPTFAAIPDFTLASLGVQFDFVLAHSILSHTFEDLAVRVLSGIHDCLAADGVLIGSFVESDQSRSGTGWRYPECVSYTWPELQALAFHAGLAVDRLSWPHPRQDWFAGAKSQPRLEEVRTRVRDLSSSAAGGS